MPIRNQIKHKLRKIDVVILCGGMGTRLGGAVGDRPKSMVKINQQPFLDILINYFSGFGFRRFILCTGHKSQVIRDHYSRRKEPLEFVISNEQTPLGTAGAVKNAQRFIAGDTFLVANGDSFCSVDLAQFHNFHLEKRSLMSMVVVEAKDATSYGSVLINTESRVLGFKEKKHKQASGFTNAGIYLFQKEILSAIPVGAKYSLEYDVFPKILNQPCYAFLTDGNLIDIGTPQRLELAKKFFSTYTYKKEDFYAA